MIRIVLIIYQWVLVVTDFVSLIVIGSWFYLVALWRTIYPKPQKSLVGKIVLVTGAGHGIGRELSLQMSRIGAKIICWDINEETNNRTVEEIRGEAGVAWGYRCDVADKNHVHEVSLKVRREIGDIDILVNNAGIMPVKPFLSHSAEDVEKLFQINVFAHFWTLREWLPVFMERGHGHVVALSSIAGLLGTTNLVPYSATKYAIRGLMEGLKEELRYGNRYSDIKITCIHPFVVDTGLAKKIRIRFPTVNPVTTTETAASTIITALRREEYSICIPERDFYTYKLSCMMPLALKHAVIDFLDAGVEEST